MNGEGAKWNRLLVAPDLCLSWYTMRKCFQYISERNHVSDIQAEYKKRKKISIGLLVLLYACLIVFCVMISRGEHPFTILELSLFGTAILLFIVMCFTLRCPKCGGFLGASWRWPKFCSRCGQKLVE